MKIPIAPYSGVSRLSPGQIALGYAVIAMLWIAFSDAVVGHFNLHPIVMTVKGTVFVFVTASLLYFTISRLVQAVQLTSQERDETAKLYRTVVEASNEGICLLDESGRISFLNRRLAAMLGRSAEEVQGKQLKDFLEEPHVLAQPGAQSSETHECQVRTDSGRQLCTLISQHPVLNDAGEMVQRVCTAIDITERSRAEEALRERADLLNLTHDAVFAMDIKGVIKYWNRGAEERYGWKAEQVMGKVVHDMLNTVFPSPLEEIKAEVTRTGRWEGELLHTKKDGSRVVMASRWALQRDEQGAPVAVLETNNDITERKQADEALRRLNRELRAISDCNQSLLRASDEQSLVEDVCRIVCEEAGYRPVWVSYVEHDEAKSVRLVAWAGTDKTYLDNARISWSEETERGHGPTGTAIRSGNTCCIQNFATDPRVAPWREILLHGGFRSALALPLKNEHANVFGCLTMHSDRPEAFTPEEIRLLEELAGDLAFGIVTLRSQAARRQAEQELTLLTYALSKVSDETYLIDETAHFRYVNEAVCRGLGYTRAELLGMGIPDIDPEFPAERWQAHWCELKAVRTLNFETVHRSRDGRVFPVEVSSNYLEYGGRAYIFSLSRDITARKQAEEERHQSAERFRAIADYTYDWENWFGIDGKLLWVNPAVERITGYSIAECMVMPDFPIPLVAEADRETFAGQMREAVQGSSRNDFEFRVRRKDGRLAWVAASWQPIHDSRGARLGYRSSIRDIAERKRAEEAMRRSEAYLAEAERLSHSGTWAFDVATDNYIYVSEECFRIFELDPQEGLPARKAISRLIHEEDWDVVRVSFDKTLREKTDTSTEFRVALPSGKIKHIQATRHPLLNGAGDVVQLMGIVIDVTERKRAEEALRESETRFRTFVDHAGDALFVQDLEQRTIVDVNRQACDSLGYSREELIGKTPLVFHLDSDREGIEAVVEQASAGETVSDRHWHRRKDGSTFPVEAQATLVSYDGRRFLLKVARDISDRLRAEEQRDKLRQLEAELAHLDRLTMLGELTASIAHEVNQPLSGVVSNGSACLRWLAGDVPNLEEAREAARRIVRDGKRAGEVIARIRALTKKASTPREKLDLNETLRQVLALVRDEAIRKSVNIRTKFADDLFPVSGDQVQLQQVVLNLAINAIEAMSSIGERTRELVITTRNIGKDQVQVTVEDSGVGLDPNAMQKIFEPFYTTKRTGMGMGLSISRSILQSHGGRLWATAKEDPGTTFSFILPKYHEEESHAGLSAA